MTERFTPQEQAVVEEIMGKVEGTKNVMVLGQSFLDISRRFGKLDLQAIETLFRERKSPIYLVSITLKERQPYFSKLPHSGDKQYPYFLWIGVEGHLGAMMAMETEGTSDSANFERLPDTGMLIPKTQSANIRTLRSPTT